MSSPVEAIKERLDIATVVGSYLKLEKAGTYLKARCPFHNEKTPSFFVSPGRGSFHCFGCGASGDIFSFVEQFEGLEFKEALKLLGERAGVDIREESKGTRDARERQYELLAEASRYFVRTRLETPAVAEYLAGRGLQAETIEAWQIGYARDEWRALHDHLLEAGYSKEELEQVGLIKHPEGSPDKHYDRFRGRIMFPIADRAGRVVGFSGRLFSPEGASEKEGAPKYLNSPETPLFNKSRILHGFDKAKQSIRTLNCSIIVEGQLDLIASHQAGFGNTVAPSGTAVTQSQLEMLGQLSKNVVIAFDPDEAGSSSAGKATKLALSMGMDVKLAALPDGVDPADLIKQDSAAWKSAIKHSMHVVDFYLDKLRRASYDERTFRLRVQETVLPFVRLIENRIDQAHFVTRIAHELSVPEEAVWDELRKLPESEEAYSREQVPAQAPRAAREREALPLADVLYRALEDLVALASHDATRRFETEALEKSLERLKTEYGERFPHIPEKDEETLARAEARFDDVSDLRREATELIRRLESVLAKDVLAETMRELRDAESRRDTSAIERALATCKELSDKVARLNAVEEEMMNTSGDTH